MQIVRTVNGVVEMIEVNVRVVNGMVVHVYPPGQAEGAMDLRNRGFLLEYEVTCWPKHRSTEYGVLTTGGAAPKRRSAAPSANETYILSRMGKGETGFQAMATRWYAEVDFRRQVAAEVEKLKLEKPKLFT